MSAPAAAGLGPPDRKPKEGAAASLRAREQDPGSCRADLAGRRGRGRVTRAPEVVSSGVVRSAEPQCGFSPPRGLAVCIRTCHSS